MQESTSSGTKTVWIIVGIVIAILCCCLIILAGAGYWVYQNADGMLNESFDPSELITPTTSTPSGPIVVERPPVEDVPSDTLEILNTTTVPENDPYELSCRLKGICDVPRTVQGKSYQLGDKENFWILNSDTITHHQTEATLLYITPHTYFWAENGIDVDEDEMKELMDTFEEEIYPTDREFFGSESNPGIDGDPHIFIIYASGFGSSVAGYFNSTDAYNPLIKEHSNAHETYFLSATQDLGDEYTYATLAHEFVHMIQFPTDRNDSTWMGEGFAEVGSFINGYDVGGWDWVYAGEPDLQLTDWNAQPGTNGPHYGQSFLYLAYFLDRFGESVTKAVNNNPEDDLASIDGTLADLNITDPLTEQIITADDVFMDWAAAMYLQDASVGDGRFVYHNYPNAPQTSNTETIHDCPQSSMNRSVFQYGIDYIGIKCPGEYTLTFSGSTQVGLLPADVHSGSYAFWSNKGDESGMTLTREFDFTNVNGPIEISYWTWYEIEEDWDYLYLEASTDGKTWEILKTPSGTDSNPSGNSYGWGYTGTSRDWIEESVDLSNYAGQKVQIRFEYITDLAVNGEGMLIDDIRIDAIDYASDFESDNGGWEANGFVRVQNVLPQTFQLALILKGDDTTVQIIELSEELTVDIPLLLGNEYDEAILVVTGTTRFTREPANYSIEIK